MTLFQLTTWTSAGLEVQERCFHPRCPESRRGLITEASVRCLEAGNLPKASSKSRSWGRKSRGRSSVSLWSGLRTERICPQLLQRNDLKKSSVSQFVFEDISKEGGQVVTEAPSSSNPSGNIRNSSRLKLETGCDGFKFRVGSCRQLLLIILLYTLYPIFLFEMFLWYLNRTILFWKYFGN